MSVNLISSFKDLKLYGGATASTTQLVCAANGAYAALRIQADPLSEITVKCLCKVTGTASNAGIAIAYPSTENIITSAAGSNNDWEELELKFVVPMSSDSVDGYVEIRFGSIGTGTAIFAKPVISVDKSSRCAAGIVAAGAIIIAGGSVSLNTSHSNVGIESVAINATLLWVDITLSNRYSAAGSALFPVPTATLDPNTTTNVAKVVLGNQSGVNANVLRLYLLDGSNNAINLSTANARVNFNVIGF